MKNIGNNIYALQENIITVLNHYFPEKAKEIIRIIFEKMQDRKIQEFIHKNNDGETIAMAFIFYLI